MTPSEIPHEFTILFTWSDISSEMQLIPKNCQLYQLISYFARQSDAFFSQIFSFRAKTRRLSIISIFVLLTLNSIITRQTILTRKMAFKIKITVGLLICCANTHDRKSNILERAYLHQNEQPRIFATALRGYARVWIVTISRDDWKITRFSYTRRNLACKIPCCNSFFSSFSLLVSDWCQSITIQDETWLSFDRQRHPASDT